VSSIPNSYYDLGSSDVVPGIPWLILIGDRSGSSDNVLSSKDVSRSVDIRNRQQCRSGISGGHPVRRVLFLTYVLCGLLAGIGGLIYLCHVGSADSTTGSDSNVNLNAIAAALIGGTALSAGGQASRCCPRGGVPVGALTAMVFLRIPRSGNRLAWGP